MSGWRRIDEPAERDRMLDAAIEHMRELRASAEGQRAPAARMRRGEIWHRTTDAGEITAWTIPDDGRVALAGVSCPPLSPTHLAELIRELGRDAGWQGTWQFGALTDDETMTALATGLDAHRVATKMQLDVRAAPEPVGIRLQPMDDADYAAYRAEADEGYAQERFASGSDATIEAARRVAAEQMAQLLPEAQRTESHRLWTVRDEADQQIGILWVQLREIDAFIYDIEIAEQQRGRGFGTQTLRAAAAETRRAGLPVLRLNVFGSNDAARRLYAREGYRETEVLWSAPIG